MPRYTLSTGSYKTRSLIANAQRCINMFPESNIADSPAPTTFYQRPGFVVWSTMPGTGPVRCLFEASNNVLFGVQGQKLYRYSAGSWIELATLDTTQGPVYASDNGVDVVFVDGTLLAPTVHLTDFTTGVMSGDGWYGSDFVYYLDGRLIFNKPDTQIFYWTGLLELTCDPLDFASAEGLPDKLVSFIVDHREIWLLGETTLEIFYSSGDADLPFTRMQGAFNQYGCQAKYSLAALDNTIYWLGRDKNGGALVFRAANYQPQVVSTPAISDEISRYSTITDALAFTYQQGGHGFYILVFPTENKTWVFDVTTNQWHERAYRTDLNALLRYRGNCSIYFGGMNLMGDFEDGRVFRLDETVYTDDGDEILFQKDFPHITTDGVRQFFRRFVLDCEVAVGNTNDPDPQIWLSWSDDGGRSWSATLQAPLGKIGEYKNRVQWHRLGSGRDRVWRVASTADASFVFQGAFLEAQPGTT